MTPTDEKPMTVDALIENTRLAWYLGQRYWQQADSESYADNKRSALTLEKFNKLLESSRAAIEQYGREQGFESTAQRDVREACYELRDALGNPVISGTGDQTIQGQTIRMAAARLRGAHLPAGTALYAAPQSREPQWRMEGDDMTTDKPMTVDALMAMVQQLALAHFNPSLAPTTLDEYRHSLRTAIEQYGREREAAGRGSGEPVAVEPIIDAYLDDYETAYDEGSSAPDADTKFVIKDAIMGLLADDEFVKAVTPQPREPLTDEQIWQAVGVVLDDSMVKLRDVVPLARAIERAHGIMSKP